MKIALATRDGKNVTQHFGRMKMYVIVDIEDGREAGREVRELGETPGRGHDNGHHRRHAHVLASVQDCDVVVAGGMGFPIQEHAREAGMEVILTSVRPVDEVIAQFIAGTLVHEADRAHDHRH
ncbi:MAG: NifB/NifX family molybdenum-iron cluster-binding protein [Actinomycetota bacterium]